MEYMTPNFTKDMVKTHKILIPNMAVTQFRLMQAALASEGYQTEVLGNCGSEVAQLGLKYVHNDTCYPALLVIGQFLDALNSGKYDLDHTALLITQTGGGCRASNYIKLLRKALVKAGYGNIPVASLNFSGLEKGSGLPLTVPLLLAGVGLCGVLTGTDVFSALTDGARDGLKTVMRIFPALVALLTAVSMLRASGALEALTRLCAPILARLGIPPETAMLLLVRPISGSGALAAASDIIQTYGADSRIGRTAAVMLGSTETTFYVLAVYFGACGIRHSRWAIPAAIVADVTGFVTAAALVRCLWGT